jgi:hypothetical protein
MTTDPNLTPEARAERTRARERRERYRAIREWVILSLAVIVGVVVLLQQFHTSSVTACQAAYNNAFAANLVQRATLGDQDRQATKDLIEGVFKPPASALKSEQARRAYTVRLFDSYERVEDRITADRKAHPYPRLPSVACR